MTAATIDAAKLEAFVGQALGELGATLNTALVVMGDQLGLYRAMAESGPITPTELARKTGAGERYVREWLNAQAAGGYVEYDPADGSYTLPPEQAICLTDETSPYFLPGAFQLFAASVRDEPAITEAARTGGGFGWHQHSQGVFDGTERFFRPGYVAYLIDAWIPALDGVEAKLRAGARVVDVGCGHGSSTILMAKAYPAVPLRRRRLPRRLDRDGPRARGRGRRRVTGSPSRSPPPRTSRAAAMTWSPRSTASTTWATRSARPATFVRRWPRTGPG